MNFGDFVLLMFFVGAISTVLAASNSTSESDVKTMKLSLEISVQFGDLPQHQCTEEQAQAFMVDAMQLINVDDQNRIIGEITLTFLGDQAFMEPSRKSVNLIYHNVGYRYIGIRPVDRFNQKTWNLVLYMRGVMLGDDNDIYYGYAPKLMSYHRSESGWPSGRKPEESTVYHAAPIVIKTFEVKRFEGTDKWTIFQHTKKPLNNQNYLNSDWISNHGIYRLYDTRVGGKSGEDIMHNIYYPVVQHLGSYFT